MTVTAMGARVVKIVAAAAAAAAPDWTATASSSPHSQSEVGVAAVRGAEKDSLDAALAAAATTTRAATPPDWTADPSSSPHSQSEVGVAESAGKMSAPPNHPPLMIIRGWFPFAAVAAGAAASAAEANATADDKKGDGAEDGEAGGGEVHTVSDALLAAREVYAAAASASVISYWTVNASSSLSGQSAAVIAGELGGAEYVGWFDGCCPHGRGRFRSPAREEYVGRCRV